MNYDDAHIRANCISEALQMSNRIPGRTVERVVKDAQVLYDFVTNSAPRLATEAAVGPAPLSPKERFTRLLASRIAAINEMDIIVHGLPSGDPLHRSIIREMIDAEAISQAFGESPASGKVA